MLFLDKNQKQQQVICDHLYLWLVFQQGWIRSRTKIQKKFTKIYKMGRGPHKLFCRKFTKKKKKYS